MDTQTDESSDSESEDYKDEKSQPKQAKNNNPVQTTDKGFWMNMLQKAFNKTGNYLMGSIEGKTLS